MSSYWSYPFNPPIKPEFQLDLGQGDTPLQDFTTQVQSFYQLKDISYQLFLKREDLNPNGSFKDRALAYQISYLQQQNAKYCVLSSSGNAAISCCAFCQKTNIKPIILVSPNIPPNKLSQIIAHKPFLLIKSSQARRLAKYIHKKHHPPLLNPSADQKAIEGFKTLGQEISDQLPDCNRIFTYSTSGASILGIISNYHANQLTPPPIVAVQTFSDKISKQELLERPQFYTTNNDQKIIKAIGQTGGSVYGINSELIAPQLEKIKQLLWENKIYSSIEGIACLHASIGFIQSALETKKKVNIPKNIVVIISGKEHELSPLPYNYQIHTAHNLKDIDRILENHNLND